MILLRVPLDLATVDAAQPLAPVLVGLNSLAPPAVVDVPAHRAEDAGREIGCRLPAQVAANLGRVNRVAAVVAWAIRHEPLQLAVTLLALRRERGIFCR